MRRLHTVDSYKKRIDKMRSSSREIAITTDIIVGFPGETDKDFEETVKLVEYCEYDAAYIFKYSPRPGTPAFEMADDVLPSVKTERFLKLETVQRRLQTRRMQAYLGRNVEVLAEKLSTKSDDHISGHSTCHRVVNFAGTSDMLGKIVNVKVNEVKTNSLFGEVVP
jgi:tRNA-2-methylthio-N6-dimethylallyladenosine synthase